MITQEPATEANRTMTLAQRRAFMRLPLDERRKQLAEQANLTIEHYESEPELTERAEWQGGDVVES